MGANEMPDRAGTLLAGKFRLVSRLGAGGMGEVYRAINESSKREVAIKILKPEFAQSADVVARVEREAQAANAVRHPNLVDVYDVSRDEHGAPFIVQELLTGTDLAGHVTANGGALSEADAVAIMLPVTEALGAAHAAGIMHRDLKLENVFMARQSDGRLVPKVLDFGLSRGVGEDAVNRLTATGIAMGTPMYMSPEQVQGQRDVDQRTDVWALGIMLYELTVGRLPFEGESLGAIFVKVCTADPTPLRVVAPHLSEAFEGVVSRCLQRDRSLRYPTARELAEDLRRLQAGAPTLVGVPAASVPVDVRAHTLAVGVSSGQAIASLPTMAGARPSGVAEPRMNTLQSAVSELPSSPTHAVPVASRKRLPVVLAVAALTCVAVVAAGAMAMRRDGGPQPSVRAAVGTSTYDGHPAPTRAVGATAYEGHAAPPTPAAPALHYDTPAAPLAPVAPAVAAPVAPVATGGVVDDASAHGRRHGRRARGGARHGTQSATPAGPQTPGTSDYDR